MSKNLVLLVLLAVAGLCVSIANATVLFEDNFDSYAAMGGNLTLNNAAPTMWSLPWADASHAVKVGSWWPGIAYFSNSYWADPEVRLARAILPETMSDYTVKVDAFEYPGYGCDWYVAGRITDSTYVHMGIVRGSAGTDGSIPLYIRLADSAGAYVGDYYFGVWDNTLPVTMSLSFEGAHVTALATHGTYSYTLAYDTAVLNAGAPGFGGQYKWGYGLGKFDNFVVNTIPEPATLILLGAGLLGLRRKSA